MNTSKSPAEVGAKERAMSDTKIQLENLLKFLNGPSSEEIDAMSEDDLDDLLRAEGGDPEAIAARCKEKVGALMAAYAIKRGEQ
jgi:hypothetical protein